MEADRQLVIVSRLYITGSGRTGCKVYRQRALIKITSIRLRWRQWAEPYSASRNYLRPVTRLPRRKVQRPAYAKFLAEGVCDAN